MPYKPNVGPLAMPQYQAPMAQIAPQQPGLGEQLAKSAASKLAAEQVGKLGLQAAGTAAAGPLGGAVAGAAGDLAGPLASKLVGGLFNKGGPVYAFGGFDFGNYMDMVNKPGGLEKATNYAVSKGIDADFASDSTWEDPSALEAYDKSNYIRAGKNKNEWIHKDDKADYLAAKKLGFNDPNREARLQAELKNPMLDPGRKAVLQKALAKINAGKTPSKEEAAVLEEVEATPTPAPIDRAVGGSRGISGTWSNVPLGSIGDWNLSTSGGLQGDMKMNDGTKQKGGWNASINATTPTGFLNDIFGGNTKKALADSASIYNESVAKDIAEGNKGSSAYWKSLGYSDDEAMDKIMEHLGMNQGGPVKQQKKSIWGQIKDKVTGDFSKRSNLMGGKQKKPTYKAMGGMTPGPLGLSDLQMVGKPEDVSKVVMKKKGGDVEDTVELNYHTPLKYQKPTNTGE